jgi:diguanylate cyclase
MIKYNENLTQSAEYLRMILPLMAKHKAPFNPICYSVWYEYVAGINQSLRCDIDKQTESGEILDEAAINTLYQKHVAEIDDETAQRVRSGFQTVLADMSQSASVAGDKANQFGSALEQWTAEASANLGSAAVEGIDALLGNTRNMQDAIGDLSQRLDESQQKIEHLRLEVERAREDALLDGLTGLVNRKGFDLALSASLSTNEPDQRGPSLLMTDIDHFKVVNDTYGHLFGDKVIRSVSQILKDNVRGKDTAARFGGEEFVILLPETPLDGAKFLAEKIRSIIEKSRIRRSGANEQSSGVTISVGVASYLKGESAAEFVERADKALYEAKHAGRNLVSVSNPAVRDKK